jgi:peptidyl-prolyl cis-trans isomerase NIMA-interacting 1
MQRATVLVSIFTLAASLLGCDPPPAPSGSAPAETASGRTPPPPPASEIPSSLTPGTPGQPSQAAEAPPEVVAAQHLLVAYKGAKGAAKSITRSKADAKKRAEEALGKARKGDDFTALVKAYSDEPGAVDRQGSLGKFKHEAMTKPFSDAAFALKVGEISEVVETDFGFHVIKRNQ